MGYYYSVTQNSTRYPDQNYLTEGEAYSNSGSYYGTFDQGGNVWEWNDAVISSTRGLRGASWASSVDYLQSSNRYNNAPTYEAASVGFRVASVPEPSAAVLMLMGGGAWLLWRRRRNTL